MGAPETIRIDEVEYVRKDQMGVPAQSVDGMEYCIVRTQSAGVFAGYLKSRDGQEGVIANARRLWYWDGAASLSQLAVDGVSKPKNCKFPTEVSEITVLQIIEILPATEKARKSISGVTDWEA